MTTEIQFGVQYMASGIVLPMKTDKEAYLVVDRLTEYKIPAEVVCRRVTFGAWVAPRVKLLSRG